MWGVDHKNIVSYWILHWLIWPLGLVVPPHPLCIKIVQYHLSWCYQNVTLQGCFGHPPHPYPHFYQENPRHRKWISILIQKLTFFVLLRSWFKMEWSNKNFNNSHGVTLKKWTNFFYIFGLISRHISMKKEVSCSSFIALVDFLLKIQNNWFNFQRFFWGLSNFY